MSEEQFNGRLINTGHTSLHFDKCEVCNKNVPNWIETKNIAGIVEIKVTCNDCHQEPLQTVDDTPYDEFAVFDKQPETETEVDTSKRPAWMQDFIEEQKESGNIEIVGGDEVSTSNIESFEQLEPLSNEIESSDVNDDILHTRSAEDIMDIAPWSGGFIKEALFGPNPEEWLSNQGGFDKENIDLTIQTLTKMSDNDVGSVKISAILCLKGVHSRFSAKGAAVISSLQAFLSDIDETVSQYAQQMIDQTK